ncbi:MAG: tyrosine-type recombinase/integrase [Lysobacterales bacterium]
MPHLTATQAKHAKVPPGQTQTKLFDTKGLYLLVKVGQDPDKPGKWWRLRYKIHGKEKLLSLGALADVSLKDARDSRDEALKLIDRGIDPSQHRRAVRARHDPDSPDTFESIAREWLAGMSMKWSKSTTQQNTDRLEQMVFPYLGGQLIGDIMAPDVLQCLKRIESRGACETAYRVKSLMNRVYQYAIPAGRAQRNPVADIGNAALFRPKTNHMGAITERKEIGALLRAIDSYHGTETVRAALRLAPLVFTRPGELRKAAWSDFDLEGKVWRIPADKMKMDRDHLVPLSSQALAILEDLRALTGGGHYVFPGARSADRCMSENTVNAAFRRMDYPKGTMTGHGFRTMASTLLHELGWNSDVIERQLAHAEGNKVKAAYNRARHLPEREKMVQEWADYLDTLRDGATVTPINSKRAAKAEE